MVGPGEGARLAFLLRLHPGHQPTEKCVDRAVGTGGLRTGEASGHQPRGPAPLQSVPGEAGGAPGPQGPSGLGRLCLIPHLPPSGDGSWLPLLLCPGENEGAKKHVTCLLAEDGIALTEPVEMCGRAHAFYASLFSPDPTNPGACRMLWEELPMVSASDRDRLELPLSLAEFSEALRRMPTNKSPGMDGLTVEFYRVFWDILHPDLVTVWAESLQSGVLPLSCRQAVLALLPKKGDLCDLRNWHPVSLLSTDYKIIVKAISLRLVSVLADMIHPDQTYTILECSIFDNLFLVLDLLELGCRDGLSFALLSLDQEKAFDRVDHGYLLNTLRAFGFGPQFVGFLWVLYASTECLVKLN
ncbi:unnamed protein product [Lepidochelys kempii]